MEELINEAILSCETRLKKAQEIYLVKPMPEYLMDIVFSLCREVDYLKSLKQKTQEPLWT